MTRIQDEYDLNKVSGQMNYTEDQYEYYKNMLAEKYKKYKLTPEIVGSMKENAKIMHPLPRRDELPVEIDDDSRSVYWDAITYGKFVRMALIYHIFRQ